MISVFLESIFEWILQQLVGTAFSFLLGHMSSDGLLIFDLEPVKLIINGFYKVGLALWGMGIVVAVFDIAIQYGHGRGTPQDLMLNYVRSYLAALLFTVLPIPFYKLMLTAGWKIGGAMTTGGDPFADGFAEAWTRLDTMHMGLMLSFIFGLVFLIVAILNYFSFIKRSFYLFFLVCVGCLYMASIPRGYTDGFTSWCKQVIGLCFGSFLQMVGLGICLWLINDKTFLIGIVGLFGTLAVDRLMQSFGGASGQTNLSGIGMQAYYGISALSRLAH